MLPDHAPMLAPNVVCHKCGSVLKPTPIMGSRGLECVRYQCINTTTGCSYRIESNVMLTGEMIGLRFDGKAVKL